MPKKYKEGIYMGVAPVTSANSIKLNDGTSVQADSDAIHDYLNRKFELIEEITLTEDTALIERTTEPNGTVYNFTTVYVELQTAIALASSNTYVQVNSIPCARLSTIPSTTVRYASAIRTIINGLLFQVNTTPLNDIRDSYTGSLITTPYIKRTITGNITNIKISCVDSLITDSVIKIYAVRAQEV